MEYKLFKITLFGSVQISDGEHTVDLTQSLGKLLVSIFEMIVYHRENPLSKETFMDTFWENSDNPRNVLNYSIFRLRSILKQESLLKGVDLIINKQNCYTLNPEYEYEIDCETFEQIYKEIKEMNMMDVEKAEQMLNVYNGDLYHNGQSSWTIKTATYYRLIYQDVIHSLCDLYMNKSAYEEVIRIATKAVALHQDNEEAHASILKALIKLEEYNDALDYYYKAVRLFKSLDIPVIEEIRDAYHIIQTNNSKQMSIGEAMSRLDVIKKEQALYCDYQIFEYMYNYFLREGARTKEDFYIIMFSIQNANDEVIGKVSKKLKEVIKKTLRSCDVFTNLNKEQFLVLISSKGTEGAMVAAQRVLSSFQKSIGKYKVSLNYYVEQAKYDKELETLR